MTFLEAAIELLRQAGGPLSVKDLTERAVAQKLLTNSGRTPELTMQARLAQELRKGEGTLLVKMNTNTYGLRRYDKARYAEGAGIPVDDVVVSAPAAARFDDEAEAPGQGDEGDEGDGEVAGASDEGGEAAAGEAAVGGEAKRKRRRRGGRGRGRGGEKKAADGAENGVAVVAAVETAAPVRVPEPGTPEEALAAEQLAEAFEAEAEAAKVAKRHVAQAARRVEEARAAAVDAGPDLLSQPRGDDEPGLDLDALMVPQTRRRVPVGDLPSDEELAAQYGDEMSSGASAPVEGEVVDERTADEDRPMLDEITAGDRGRRRGGARRGREAGGREAGGGRGGRRERPARPDRDRARDPGVAPPRPAAKAAEGGERDAERPQGRDAARRERAPVATPAAELTPPVRSAQGGHGGGGGGGGAASTPAPAAPAGPANTLGDLAVQLLRGGDGRPVHVRQLAALAAKRRGGAAAGEGEDLVRPFEAALRQEPRARLARGLRPRARAHGPEHFVATPRPDGELGNLEELITGKLEQHARETRLAVRRRLARLPLGALEIVARLLLERLGYTEIERVKRVEQTGYLSARGKWGALSMRVLVAVRAGGEEAARRAVGELRAGVMAKQLDGGLLLCTARVGAEADKEARQPGPPITAFDGDAFADALVGAGVGVMTAAIPVAYFDPDFFAELGEG